MKLIHLLSPTYLETRIGEDIDIAAKKFNRRIQ